MIRILIADDHPLIREGLKTLLQDEPDLTVVREARTASEVLQYTVKKEVDVVVLDISLPDRSGLDVLRELKKLQPKLPVLILSMHPEKRFALRALKAGASGYITKETVSEELVKAIRKVNQRGKYVSSALAEILASEVGSSKGQMPHEALSNREFDVFRMIANGKAMAEIAEELHLSLSTVHTYRARILAKMNMQSTAELIHYGVHNNLIE